MMSRTAILVTFIFYILGSALAAPIGYGYGRHVQAAEDKGNCTDDVSFQEEKDKWNCDKAIDSTIQACSSVCSESCLEEINEVCGPHTHLPQKPTGL